MRPPFASILLGLAMLATLGGSSPVHASTCSGQWVLSDSCAFTIGPGGYVDFGANATGTASVNMYVVDSANNVVAGCSNTQPVFASCNAFASGLVPGSYLCRVSGTFVGTYKCTGAP